jgi:hypothetical protein
MVPSTRVGTTRHHGQSRRSKEPGTLRHAPAGPDLPYSILASSMVFSSRMKTARKITLEVPSELLAKAQRASGTGITQTVRAGLQLVAASKTYARLRQLRGKVRFSRTVGELKADR